MICVLHHVTHLQVSELEQLRREDAERFQCSYEVGIPHPIHVHVASPYAKKKICMYSSHQHVQNVIHPYLPLFHTHTHTHTHSAKGHGDKEGLGESESPSGTPGDSARCSSGNPPPPTHTHIQSFAVSKILAIFAIIIILLLLIHLSLCPF